MNCVQGLRLIQKELTELGLPNHVYGPEVPITAIIPMALGLTDVLAEGWMEEEEGKPSQTPYIKPAPAPEGGEASPSPIQRSSSIVMKERHPH